MDGMTAVTANVVEMLRAHGTDPAVLQGGRGRSRRPAYQRLRRQVTLLLQAARLVPLRRSGCGVLYLPSDSRGGLPRVLLTMLVARGLGFAVVLHHHVFTYVDRRSLWMAAICRVGGRRLRHVVLCPGMDEAFRARYAPKGAVAVVSNVAFGGLARPAGSPVVVGAQRERRIGIFGNLTRDKGIVDFLELVERCRDLPSIEFLAGGPVADELRDVFDEQVASGAVVATGPLYGDDRTAFLRDLDLLVFPSTYRAEAEPLVIWEAVSLGVPVVAYGRGCIGEQLPADHVVRDLDALVAWVRAFVDDPSDRRRAASARAETVPAVRAAERERFLVFLGRR